MSTGRSVDRLEGSGAGVSFRPWVVGRGASRGPRLGSTRPSRKRCPISSAMSLGDIVPAMGASTGASNRKAKAKRMRPTIPPVIREAPNYPITLPMTGQFLAMAACATSPVPPAEGRVAPPSNESLRRHVAGSRPARQIDGLGRCDRQRSSRLCRASCSTY